jgi:hypothetical protein
MWLVARGRSAGGALGDVVGHGRAPKEKAKPFPAWPLSQQYGKLLLRL